MGGEGGGGEKERGRMEGEGGGRKAKGKKCGWGGGGVWGEVGREEKRGRGE